MPGVLGIERDWRSRADRRTASPHAAGRGRRAVTRATRRAAIGGIALAALAAGVIYVGDPFGVRGPRSSPSGQPGQSPFAPAVDRGDVAATAPARRRSQPYWVPVRRFAGRGPLTTPGFPVDERALQWRVVWRCQRAPLLILPQRRTGQQGRPLAQVESCPARGEGRSVAGGAFRLRVAAGGPWQMRVEEQLDAPLVEPPTAAMRDARTRVVARGDIYGIDEEGSGSLTVFREPGGGLSLRLADLYVTPNVDLRIRLSSLERPTSTRQVARAPHRDVAFLEATTGSMNLRLPAGALRTGVRSVVIWSEITRNAYAAARLGS